MYGPTLLAKTLPKVTKKICSRKFVMLGRLMDHWDDIMGESFAFKTQPVKIRYFKAKRKNEGPTAALDIAASPSDATLLQYQKQLILERLNMIFGSDSYINDIRFVPQTANQQSRAPKAPIQRRALLPSETKQLAELVSDIQDAEIREKLLNFGKAVLQDKTTSL